MNFSEVKTILESVTALVKKAATIDLQEKIINLREYIISLKDENISLKEENQHLKTQLSNKEDFILRNGFFWKKEDPVPFCQKCFEGSSKAIHLQLWNSRGGWKCFECDKYYGTTEVKIFEPRPDRRNEAF